MELENILVFGLAVSVGGKDAEFLQGPSAFLVGESQADTGHRHYPAQIDFEPPILYGRVLVGLPVGQGITVNDQIGRGLPRTDLPNTALGFAAFF